MSIFSRTKQSVQLKENTLKNQTTTLSKKTTSSTTSFGETGYTGTKFFSGFISGEEYLPELTGQDGVAVYDRMRRSDGQVQGILKALFLPILQANWYIETPGQDKTSIDMSYEIEKNILKRTDITWKNTLRQILSYLPFGYSIFERVYEYKDGLIRLKKLAPRIQKTLYKWNVKDDGTLESITQYIMRPNSKTEYIDISSNKLVVFTNDMEGSNFEGISILRGAYKHWWIKDELYKIDAIGHDRFASGVPYATEPQQPNPADRTRAETALANLHSREKSWLIKPYGWEMGILEKSGSNDSVMKSITHHNEEMAKSILAQFINLGTGQSGSFALGASFEELFLMSLNAISSDICETLNNTVIKELAEYNYNIKDDNYPILKCSKIMLNVKEFIMGLKEAAGGGLLKVDLDIENHVRELYGLQKITEDQDTGSVGDSEVKDKMNKEKKVVKEDEDIIDDKKKKEPKLHDKNCNCEKKLSEYQHRTLSDIEIKCADVFQIKKMFDEGAIRNAKVINNLRNDQIEAIAKQVITREPADIRAPKVAEMAKALYDEMVKSYKQARKDLIKELTNQVPDTNVILADQKSEMETMKLLKLKSKAFAVATGNKLINNALFQVSRIPLESDEDEAVEQLIATMKTTGTKDIERMAQVVANYAYGLGREDEALDNQDEIEYAVYSAILDGKVCDNCLPKDMVEHEVDDPEFATPSPDCLGGEGACRCVNIYKMKDMEGDFATKSKADYEADKQSVDDGELDAEDMKARYELPKYETTLSDVKLGGTGSGRYPAGSGKSNINISSSKDYENYVDGDNQKTRDYIDRNSDIIDAVDEYTHSDFEAMNSKLRGGAAEYSDGRKADSSRMLKQTKLMRKYIDENKLENNLTLYRGVNVDNDWEVGDSVMHKGFFSSSTSESIAKSFATESGKRAVVLRVNAKTGDSFAPGFSKNSSGSFRFNKSEREFIGKDHMKFKVIGKTIKKDIVYYDIEGIK